MKIRPRIGQPSLYRYLQILAALFSLSLTSAQVNSALITYEFAGTIASTNPIFNAGDTFAGTYTFESTAPTGTVPDTTIDLIAFAINSGLPGTGWNLDVFSTTSFGNYSISGNRGWIQVGNDNSFGDRYVVSLLDETSPLPGGLDLNFFQIDIMDTQSNGADMLTSNAFQDLPNLALAGLSTGRFFTLGNTTGCTQCGILIDSLAPPSEIPVPAAIWFFVTALFGIAALTRRQKFIDV